jgi:hypothetical protein
LTLASQLTHLLERLLDVVRAEPDSLHHRHLQHRADEDAVAVLDDALEAGRRRAVDAGVLGQIADRLRDLSQSA